LADFFCEKILFRLKKNKMNKMNYKPDEQGQMILENACGSRKRESAHMTVWARSLHGLHGDAAEREPARWQVRQGSRRGQTRAVWATAADLRGLGGCERPVDGGVAYADARGLCDNGATYPMTA
jgi:hypothetical protein